jgi:drug/metabolite transporter (DMT)-like permease
MSIIGKVKIYSAVYLCYFVYSLCLVAGKYAGKYHIVSFQAIMLYGLSFLLLGIFALAWQQVLKHLPLITAHANRAITLIFGMLWGALLFSEEITWNMILGAVIIMCGIVLMVKQHE